MLLPEAEMDEIRRVARREKIPVGEWVRRTLRDARARQSSRDPQAKLNAIRKAAEYSFPAADIGQMLAEVERGYSS